MPRHDRNRTRLALLLAVGGLFGLGLQALFDELAGSPAAAAQALPPATKHGSIVYLIGDFGYPSDELVAVGAHLRERIAEVDGDGIVVELGDNVYEDGPAANPAEAATQLTAILDALGARAPAERGGAPLPMVVIPGNHDHDASFTRPWETSDSSYGAIENEMWLSLDRPEWRYYPAHLEPTGDPECPVDRPLDRDAIRAIRRSSTPGRGNDAPSTLRAWACLTRPQRVLESPPGLALIAVDSQVLIGLLHHHEEAAAEIHWRALARLLDEAAGRGESAVVIAHHPLESYGRHRPLQAGRLAFGPGWPNYTRPLDFVTALPVVAQLTVLGWYGSGWLHDQDVNGPGYGAYRRRMAELLVRHHVTLYASGHDHVLAFMDLGESTDLREIVGGPGLLYQVVSGATANRDPVCEGPANLYKNSARGHARLMLEEPIQGGESRLRIEISPLSGPSFTVPLAIRR